MEFDKQILFFFSALGAFNGFLLGTYFLFFTKNKQLSNYFLGALLFVVSTRILKSVFLFFNPHLSGAFIHIGLSACFLIGPFLYFYLLAIIDGKSKHVKNWHYHVFPVLILILIVGYVYPYRAYSFLWKPYFIKIIYFHWFIYLFISGFTIKRSLKKLFSQKEKFDELEVWAVSIFNGISIIWIAYNTTVYTSYIAGALSFSFVFYLLILLWVLKRNKNSILFERQLKYQHKKIEEGEATTILSQLRKIMAEENLFLNPNLKVSDVAQELNISSHLLSQFLNSNLGKGFTTFINEYRIEAAEKMLRKNNNLTVEGIGLECGFKSNSTFYDAFKKVKGVTPAKFKKDLS